MNCAHRYQLFWPVNVFMDRDSSGYEKLLLVSPPWKKEWETTVFINDDKVTSCATVSFSRMTLLYAVRIRIKVFFYQLKIAFGPCSNINLRMSPRNNHLGVDTTGQSFASSKFIKLIPLTLIVLMWRIGWAHNNARK